MGIIVKGSINGSSKEPVKPVQPVAPVKQTFNQVKQRATKPAQEQVDNSGLIKPKYMEDKSVFYKSSGYLKDLIGEGN